MLRRRPDVTSPRRRSAKSINATLYCARGQAENLIKQHKRKRLRTITAAVHPSPISLILNTTRVDQHFVPNPKRVFHLSPLRLAVWNGNAPARNIEAALSQDKPFRVIVWGTTFHSPQPSNSTKGFSIEPILGALCPKMLKQQRYLTGHYLGGKRHVDIGLTEVSIPFRNLVFKNEVITECIPG